jgi:hypothetical protein
LKFARKEGSRNIKAGKKRIVGTLYPFKQGSLKAKIKRIKSRRIKS